MRVSGILFLFFYLFYFPLTTHKDRTKNYYSPSETFVVLTADQFVGHNDGLLEQQTQDSHVCRRKRTFPLILRKNQFPL